MHNRARKKFFRVIRLSLFMYILVFVFLLSAGNASAKLQNEQLPINIDSLAKAHGLQVSDLLTFPAESNTGSFTANSESIRIDSIVPNILPQGKTTKVKIYLCGLGSYRTGFPWARYGFGDSTISIIADTIDPGTYSQNLTVLIKTSAVTKPGKRDFTLEIPYMYLSIDEPRVVLHLPGAITIRDSAVAGFWMTPNSIIAGQSKQVDIYGEDVVWTRTSADSVNITSSDSRMTFRDIELVDSVHLRLRIDVPADLPHGGRYISIRQYRNGALISSLTDKALYINPIPAEIVRLSRDTIKYGQSSTSYLYTKNTKFKSTGVFFVLASGTDCQILPSYIDSTTVKLTFLVKLNASPTRRDILLRYYERIDTLIYQAQLRKAFIIKPVNVTISLQDQWSLGAITRQCDDMRVKSLLPFLKAPAYGYNRNYFRAESFSTNKGYWLKGDGQKNYGGDYPKYRFAQVDSGWNLIGGSDFFAGTPGTMQVSPPGIVASPIYEFRNGTYYPASLIQAGAGYWVKCTKPGILFFKNYQGNIYPKQQALPETRPNWTNLDFTDNTGTTISLYAVPPGDSTRVAAFELPPPPPTDAFDVRFANSGSAATIPDAGNEIHLQGEHYPVTVHCKNGTVTLQDKATGGKLFSRTISDGETVQVENPAINVLQISKTEYIAPQFALLQNYPNPFNPATTIQFSLPERMDVSVRVYSALGEQIANVFSGTAEKGVNTVQWNAAGYASGVYLYRITAPGYTSTRKMLLTK